MSYLFISHSSYNDFAAIALQDWLVVQGWDELFLDLDPERGIVAGERWERALHDAASRCDAVLFCVSQQWLDSEWCRKEFRLAHRLNKRIIGLLIEDIAIDSLPSELTEVWQMVNLASGNDHEITRTTHPDTGEEQHVHFSRSGLARLKTGLIKAGLDPLFYEWPPKHDLKRSPYRGMSPLEADDAGIFFGREAPTNELLARLRGLRTDPPPRFMVVLGASGAGKSSFIRAGILPRLSRDERHFLTLPIIRPEHSVLWGEHGLLQSLIEILEHHHVDITRGLLRSQIEACVEGKMQNESNKQLIELFLQLSKKAALPALEGETQSTTPTLILTIDQGEELFHSEGAEQSSKFLTLLKTLVSAADLPLIVLFTIRSDSFEQLQTYKALEDIPQQTFSLTPMPQGAYHNIIEGPAARLKDTVRPLVIEPALTQQLLEDIEKGGNKDALPILAFTLERLYLEYGSDGDLTLEEYRMMGGLEGAIQAAVERALVDAEKDPALPNDRKAITDLLRRGLIPWLAGIDPDSQSPRRRVAKLSEIPTEAKPIILHLIEQRLLATDVDALTNEATIEPAHEALLRQWGLLQGWLEEDFAALTTLESVQRASRDWDANARNNDWLSHTAGRLQDAEELKQREDLSTFLNSTDWDYLQQCRELDNQLRDKELVKTKKLAETQKRVAKRTTIGMLVAVILTIVAGILGWQALQEKEKTQEKLIEANHNFGLALFERAKQAFERKEYNKASFYSAHTLLKAKPKNKLFYQAGEMWRNTNHHILETWTSLPVSQHSPKGNIVAFSPNGITLASSSGDNSIKIWDIPSGQLKKILKGHTAHIDSVTFSPNGTTLLSSSFDGTTKLWSLTNSQIKQPLKKFPGQAHGAIFSPDGITVASIPSAPGFSFVNNNIYLWDVTTGQLKQRLAGHSAAVNSIAFSSDGTTLASGSNDKTIKFWDVVNGQLKGTLSGHTGYVNSVAYSPDGALLVSGSKDQTIKIWDIANSQLKQTLIGHSDSVESVAFSPNGATLASGSYDNTIKIWSVIDKVWNVASGQLNQTLTAHTKGVKSVAFSPDGTTLASASEDQSIKVWDMTSNGLKQTLGGNTLLSYSGIRSTAISPDGETLATGSNDKTIIIWDIASGQLKLSLIGHSDSVKSVAFSPDGTTLVSGSSDDTIKIWDVTNGQLTQTLTEHNRAINSVVFSPDGKTLASGSHDNTIKIWDITSGQLKQTLTGHTEYIESVTFSPDGATLASGSYDKTIKTWDVTSGQVKKTLTGHSAAVNSVAFSPDGTTIVSGSNDKTIKSWHTDNGQLIQTLTGHTDGITSIAFSPDSQTLISGSLDHTIKIWDLKNEKLKKTLIGHNRWISSVTFSPDGSMLISGSDDNTIKIWDIDTNNNFSDNKFVTEWLKKQGYTTNYLLDNLNIKTKKYESNLNKDKVSPPPRWSKSHLFHWLDSAKQGNREAMLQLGIIYHRKLNQQKAKHWYSKALKAGHPKAKQRLEILELTLKNKAIRG